MRKGKTRYKKKKVGPEDYQILSRREDDIIKNKIQWKSNREYVRVIRVGEDERNKIQGQIYEWING